MYVYYIIWLIWTIMWLKWTTQLKHMQQKLISVICSYNIMNESRVVCCILCLSCFEKNIVGKLIQGRVVCTAEALLDGLLQNLYRVPGYHMS